jgi:hypothetical protein
MKIVPMILLGVLAFATTESALAAPAPTKIDNLGAEETVAPPTTGLLDGGSVDAILALAKTRGEATLETQEGGDPKISGTTGDIPYEVYFMNCTDHTACEDLNLYAGFLDLRPKPDVINTWNRDKRFGKAYLDKDGDAVVEMDINLEHGISSENLDADFAVWALVVEQFAKHVGYTTQTSSQ